NVRVDEGQPRSSGRGNSGQPFGNQYFLMLSPSVLNSTLVPRCSRIVLVVRLIMPWRLPVCWYLTLPAAVIVKRFLAPDLVFNLGIWLSSSARGASPHGRDRLTSQIWPRAACSGLSANRGHGSPYWPGSDGPRYDRGGPRMQPPATGKLTDAKMPMRHSVQAARRLSTIWGLAWRQNHDHLTAFEFRLLFDLCDRADIVLHTVEESGAQFLVCHFTAAKPQSDFDLVAVLKEALHRAHFHLIIVVVDHRSELDLLNLNDFLFFTSFRCLFLRLVLVLAVIQDFADWRRRVGGDFYQVETRHLRHV